jgi:hypothetical protein
MNEIIALCIRLFTSRTYLYDGAVEQAVIGVRTWSREETMAYTKAQEQEIWAKVAEGFVEGYVHGYYQATKTTGMDGAAVRREAHQKALEHVNILKQADGKKSAAKAKEAPLDAIFSGKE